MSLSDDIRKFQDRLRQAKGQARKAAGRGLLKFANHVIGESQALTPVDTGALAASGTVGELEEAGERMSVTIGHNTTYAAAVHERLDVHHPQGQAKYLETAVRNNIPKAAEFIANEVRSAL